MNIFRYKGNAQSGLPMIKLTPAQYMRHASSTRPPIVLDTRNILSKSLAEKEVNSLPKIYVKHK
eukprot:snap_masked-scaffold_5-processed-gene-9.9-mRNA-1 protein AED:1.00 eAED:1.00 QI:0/0/0/0/1/1/2/0/63